MLCRSPLPLQIPGPAPQAFSQGQPGPSAALAIQPELTALHALPGTASIPCTQIPLLLLLPDRKFLKGRDYGSPLELHLAKVLFLSFSFSLPSSLLFLTFNFISMLLSLSLSFVPSFSLFPQERTGLEGSWFFHF